jgi:hypothetical protein
MRYLYIILLIFYCNIVICQQININGTIREKGKDTYLPYATIGIYNTNIGTVSDKNGVFVLKVDSKIDKKTKINFSHIGFRTLEIPISALLNQNNSIELESFENTLPQVVVGLKKPRIKKIGRSSKGLAIMHVNFYSFYDKEVDDKLSREMGMKFKIGSDCRIEDLNFNITSNEYKLIKFRLNFYSIKNNLPSEILFNKDIIFSITDGFLGWYKLDLRSYDINLSKENESIAVSIQWLESVKINNDSKYFSISAAISPTDKFYSRDRGFDKWTSTNSSLSFYMNTLRD